MNRETIEKLIAKYRADEEAADARIMSLAQNLVRLASSVSPDTCDPDEIRSAADDFASAVQEKQAHRRVIRDLMQTLI